MAQEILQDKNTIKEKMQSAFQIPQTTQIILSYKEKKDQDNIEPLADGRRKSVILKQITYDMGEKTLVKTKQFFKQQYQMKNKHLENKKIFIGNKFVKPIDPYDEQSSSEDEKPETRKSKNSSLELQISDLKKQQEGAEQEQNQFFSDLQEYQDNKFVSRYMFDEEKKHYDLDGIQDMIEKTKIKINGYASNLYETKNEIDTIERLRRHAGLQSQKVQDKIWSLDIMFQELIPGGDTQNIFSHYKKLPSLHKIQTQNKTDFEKILKFKQNQKRKQLMQQYK